ncbi:MAG: sodium-dependent transporter, partial [Gemmatimonadota bacterium]|nr:sodium-dependent transporter [Gemmatimonadota bacterium]
VGAFEAGGLPGGRLIGWFFFFVVTAATAYYTNVVGWVLYFAAGEVAELLGIGVDATRILPPEEGVDGGSLARQVGMTSLVILLCASVLQKGLRQGAERVSKILLPTIFVILLILVARSVTLPGAGEGLRWYLGKFEWSAIRPVVVLGALGQAVFSMSLGGTFMVVYGSYLDRDARLGPNAVWTALGDTTAGLLAGLAIFPAVFALGLEPGSGPALLFNTLPGAFDAMPGGALFGLLFFLALGGGALLSDIAAFEVVVTGLTDNTGLSRRRAIWLMAAAVFALSVLPMVSMRVFVPWDLTFGSGMQTLGALVAALTVGWAFKRGDAIRELAGDARWGPALYLWVRWVIPAAILLVGVWWLLTDLLGAVEAA